MNKSPLGVYKSPLMMLDTSITFIKDSFEHLPSKGIILLLKDIMLNLSKHSFIEDQENFVCQGTKLDSCLHSFTIMCPHYHLLLIFHIPK